MIEAVVPEPLVGQAHGVDQELAVLRLGSDADGAGIPKIAEAFEQMVRKPRLAGASELTEMVAELNLHAPELPPSPSRPAPQLDYVQLVEKHNPRHKRRKR